MKSRIALLLLFFVSVITNVFATTEVNDTVYLDCSEQVVTTIIPNCSCQKLDSVMQNPDNINPDSFSNFVSVITFIVNDFNNILSEINNTCTIISIIISVFGIIIGILGIWGFTNLKNSSKDFNKEIDERLRSKEKLIDSKILEFDKLKNDIEEEKEKVVAIQERQDFQNEYLLKINQYLFSITNSVVDSNSSNDGTSSNIRESLYNQYYIIKAFLPWSDSETDGTEAAFRYLQVHGIEDNIVDLQFIADKDPDIKKKRLALETIGFIRAKL